MKIINKIESLRGYSEPASLVPTMGALHQGHLSLVNKAKEYPFPVWMSIYVNKLQFNKNEDYFSYPRNLDEDIEKAEMAGVDVLFVPDEKYINNKNEMEIISSGAKGGILEGLSRPGHFDGVLTVVNRLINLICPKQIIFGEKDAQQLYLIKNKLMSKFYETKFISVSTTREDSGLALSSRNNLLSDSSREIASGLFSTLKAFCFHYSNGESEGFSLDKAREHIRNYNQITLDYLEIVDAKTFEFPSKETREYYILIAAEIDGVRLIDNIRIEKKLNQYYLDLGHNLLGEKIK